MSRASPIGPREAAAVWAFILDQEADDPHRGEPVVRACRTWRETAARAGAFWRGCSMTALPGARAAPTAVGGGGS